jgi:hypothetical protein
MVWRKVLGLHLKVGIDVGAEMEMVRTVREVTGENTRIRLDANGAWAVNGSPERAQLDRYRIDFVNNRCCRIRSRACRKCGPAPRLPCANEVSGRPRTPTSESRIV